MSASIFSGFLGSLASGLFSSASSLLNNSRSVKQSKEISDYQNRLQQQSWQNQFDQMNARQDDLNASSMLTQKASARNAGISPASLTEGAFSNAVSAPSGATGGAVMQASPFNFEGVSSMVNAMSQAKLVDSQVKKNDKESDNISADTISKQIENDIKSHAKQSIITAYGQTVTLNNLDADVKASQIKLFADQSMQILTTCKQVQEATANLRVQRINMTEQNERDWEKFYLEKNVASAQVKSMLATILKTHSEINVNDSLVRKVNAEIGKIALDGNLVRANTIKSVFETVGINLGNDLTSLKIDSQKMSNQNQEKYEGTQMLLNCILTGFQCLESFTNSGKNVADVVKGIAPTM